MADSKPKITEVWGRIRSLEGELFVTKTGKEFTYSIEGFGLRPSRTDYTISRSNFQTALELAPLGGPGEINDLVRGPSYVWAILHDARIRKGW